VAERRIGVRLEECLHAFVKRGPIGAAIARLEYAAARHADVEVLRIARIDQHRVQLRAVRRSVLVAAAPRLALRMLVETFTPVQLAPPSVERNKPCGEVPAYQTPGSDACPAASQNE
jgi:hypothetical protein